MAFTIQWVLGVSLLEVKVVGAWIWARIQCSDKVKNACSYTFIHPIYIHDMVFN